MDATVNKRVQGVARVLIELRQRRGQARGCGPCHSVHHVQVARQLLGRLLGLKVERRRELLDLSRGGCIHQPSSAEQGFVLQPQYCRARVRQADGERSPQDACVLGAQHTGGGHELVLWAVDGQYKPWFGEARLDRELERRRPFQQGVDVCRIGLVGHRRRGCRTGIRNAPS